MCLFGGYLMQFSHGRNTFLNLKHGLLFSTLLVAGTTQAAVIDYNAIIDSSSALGTQTTSYLLDDAGMLPADERESAQISNNANTLITDGGALIDNTMFQFAQSVQAVGVDAYNVSSTQRLSAQYTNESGVLSTGTLNTFVAPSLLGLQSLNQSFLLSDSSNGVSASVEVSISLDGDPLLGFTARVDQSGFNSFVGAEFEALLNPTSLVDDLRNFITWGGTDVPLDLGIFAAGQTKDFVYEVTTTVENAAGNCIEQPECISTIASFGDPGSFENYSFMIVTMDTMPVPEPSSLGLLVLAGLLVARRRR